MYSSKLKWKLILTLMAAGIVLAGFWYTNRIASKIKVGEEKKIEIWQREISKKSQLLAVTDSLFSELEQEEYKKVDLWKDATNIMINLELDAGENYDLTFVLKVIQNNTTVPIIITDNQHNILDSRNLDPQVSNDSTAMLALLEEMKASYPPMTIVLGPGNRQYLYYKNSKLFSQLQGIMDDLVNSVMEEIVANAASVPVIMTNEARDSVVNFGNIDTAVLQDPILLDRKLEELADANTPKRVELGNGNHYLLFYDEPYALKQIRYYPVIQFGIIGLFLLVAYLLFSTFRKAEQNRVWVGMAKETAHQLGTPLSSLMAWVEILKEKQVDTAILSEIKKDINRLEVITDRFSKIGSEPELKSEKLLPVLEGMQAYLRPRISRRVEMSIEAGSSDVQAKFNKALLEWVLENLSKNAVDAMKGKGTLVYHVIEEAGIVAIEITDSGAGIPTNKIKTVFEPGFTTKKRGWGLGLSLAKRIIELYHDGRIYVKNSEVDVGTTFRIELKP